MGGNREEFLTHRGYSQRAKKEKALTPSMEDYLEMIFRLAGSDGKIRLKDLAQALNVRPPSVTAMAQRLRKMGLVNYQPYGLIVLTDRGREVGGSLLRRHRMLESFFQALGLKKEILLNVERIEHSLTPLATWHLELWVDFMEDNPAWKEAFKAYRARRERGKGGKS